MRLRAQVEEPMSVLAIDPGLRTGWAARDMRTGFVTAGITDPDETWEVMEVWTNQWAGYPAWLVVEKFTITTQTGKMGGNEGSLSLPLKLTGVAEYLASARGIAFDDKQTPAAAKRFGTDAKLRKAGWWDTLMYGKEDHAKDAGRHLLLALCENRVMEVPR